MEGGQVVIPFGRPGRHTLWEARSSYPLGGQVVMPLVVPGRHTFGSHGSSYLWKPRFLSLWAWILLSTRLLRLQGMGGFELSRHGSRRTVGNGSMGSGTVSLSRRLSIWTSCRGASRHRSVLAACQGGLATWFGPPSGTNIFIPLGRPGRHTPWEARSSYPFGGQVVIPSGAKRFYSSCGHSSCNHWATHGLL